MQFYREAGWSDASLETYRARFGNFGKYIHPLPDGFTHVSMRSKHANSSRWFG